MSLFLCNSRMVYTSRDCSYKVLAGTRRTNVLLKPRPCSSSVRFLQFISNLLRIRRKLPKVIYLSFILTRCLVVSSCDNLWKQRSDIASVKKSCLNCSLIYATDNIFSTKIVAGYLNQYKIVISFLILIYTLGQIKK